MGRTRADIIAEISEGDMRLAATSLESEAVRFPDSLHSERCRSVARKLRGCADELAALEAPARKDGAELIARLERVLKPFHLEARKYWTDDNPDTFAHAVMRDVLAYLLAAGDRAPGVAPATGEEP